MKITENKLNSIIAESIQRHLNEVSLKESVSRVVSQVLRESIFDGMMDAPEESFMAEKAKKHKKHHDEEDDKHHDKTNKGSSKKRQRVISYLKQDGVDVAQYAYELWPDKDEDSGRSYFYKCLDGKPNDSGEPYRFSDDEVNRLYSMISGDNI